MTEWAFDWGTDWDALWAEAFQARWRQWLDQAPDAHVFMEPSLVRGWCDVYRAHIDVEPRFVVASRGAAEVFLPMVWTRNNWRQAWYRLISPVGPSEFDYHDPVCCPTLSASDKEQFWASLLVEIQQRWAGSYDGLVIDGIRHPPTTEDWGQSDLCPQIELAATDTFDEYLLTLKKNVRGDIRRQRRRLAGLGAFEFKLFTAGEMDEALAELASFLAVHQARWPANFKAPGFHERLLRDGLANQLVHFSTLAVDGRSISWHLGFVHRDRYYWYMPAYEAEYANYSPGKVHLSYCLEDAIGRGLGTFDLLKGDEAYKRFWQVSDMPVYRLEQHQDAAVSHLKRGWQDDVKPWLRRILKPDAGS